MDKLQNNLGFRLMALGYKFRDFFLPRRDVLGEMGIKVGSTILDYGCGPGGYVAAAVEMVGKSGKIYALDIHPLAIEKVQRIISKKRLTNVETINSDCKTGLADESVDIVLLYDIFHALSAAGEVLTELHRVLRAEGILSFSDHHMEEDKIVSEVTGSGLFRLLRKGEKTYSFAKVGGQS